MIKHRASRTSRPLPGRAAGGVDLRIRSIQIAAGLTCACGFLAIALYRAPFGSVVASLARTSPLWLGAAVAAYVVDLTMRAWRWRIILRPIAALPYATVARVLVAGYGLNTIMPLRLGELFRAEFLKKTCGVPRVPALASIVVERLLDGLTVVACLGVGLLFAARARQPDAVMIDALVVGSVLFGTVLVAALCLGDHRVASLFDRFQRLSGPVLAARDGIGILRTRRTVPIAFLTVIVYLLESLSIWCVFKALGFPLGMTDTLVVLGIGALGTLLPSGPGFLGTLQLAFILGIEFAGGDSAIGAAGATLIQCCMLLPIAVVATGILIHGSGGVLGATIARREPETV
jgi:uncharacterized protein (TIRG00374 family)